ncbi:MAG: DUF3859 domain-containing protein [Hyphomonadaceae bacterium]
MRAILAALAALFLAPGLAFAQSVRVDSVAIESFGIYTGQLQQRVQRPDGRFENVSTDIKLAVQTAAIPAQIGLRFGLQYRVTGAPDGAPVALRKVVLIPQPGLKPPNAPAAVVRSETQLTAAVGVVGYTGWRFDDAYEFIPGVWTIQLWQDDRKLVEKQFTVTVAPAA